MSKLWKGLVIGGIVGLVVAAVLQSRRGSRLQQSQIPDRARQAAQRLGDSEAAAQLTEQLRGVAGRVRDVAGQARGVAAQSGDLAGQAARSATNGEGS